MSFYIFFQQSWSLALALASKILALALASKTTGLGLEHAVLDPIPGRTKIMYNNLTI